MRFLLPALLVCIFASSSEAQLRSIQGSDNIPDPPTGITTGVDDFLQPPNMSDLQALLKETDSIIVVSKKTEKQPVAVKLEVKKEEKQQIRYYRTRRRGFRR